MTREYTATSEDWAGSEVTLTYQYYPGDPGQLAGPPEKCYPPEPAEIEISSAVYADGSPCEYADDDDLYERFCDACERDWEAMMEAQQAERDDYLYEQYRDRQLEREEQDNG